MSGAFLSFDNNEIKKIAFHNSEYSIDMNKVDI